MRRDQISSPIMRLMFCSSSMGANPFRWADETPFGATLSINPEWIKNIAIHTDSTISAKSTIVPSAAGLPRIGAEQNKRRWAAIDPNHLSHPIVAHGSQRIGSHSPA